MFVLLVRKSDSKWIYLVVNLHWINICILVLIEKMYKRYNEGLGKNVITNTQKVKSIQNVYFTTIAYI